MLYHKITAFEAGFAAGANPSMQQASTLANFSVIEPVEILKRFPPPFCLHHSSFHLPATLAIIQP